MAIERSVLLSKITITIVLQIVAARRENIYTICIETSGECDYIVSDLSVVNCGR